MIKRLILFLYCIVPNLQIHLQAQSYSSVHYDTKDGLPSTTVYDISQDKDGFIWFATENGLSRFDGKSFKTFTTKDGLPDNSILKVHGDNTGRIYFAPFTHSLYYYEADSFFRVNIPDKYKLDLSNISYLFNSGNTVVIAGIYGGYLLEDNKLISLHDKYHQIPEKIYLSRVYDTLIIAGSSDSLFFVSNVGKIKSHFLYINKILGVIFDNDFQMKKIDRIENLVDFPRGGYLRDSLFYWILKDSVPIFNISNGELMHSIKINKASAAFLDNEDNLWISTLGNGVFRFSSFNFKNIDFDGESEIFSLLKFDSQILAGSDFSKMYGIPLRNSKSSYFTTNLTKFISVSKNPITHLTNRNRIYALNSDEKKLYVGTDGFLLKIEPNNRPVFRQILPVKDIDVLNKNILVCTGNSVVLLDKSKMSVIDTLLKQRATCGVVCHGNYYIGTLGGLVKIDSQNKKVTKFYDLYSPLKGRITALKRGLNNDLWIATSGSGLVHFKNDRIIQVLKEKDGLTSDICTSLFIDNNLVWLGTNNGLNRIEIDKEKFSVIRFTSANGLGADYINCVFADDSTVYVGTAAGLNTFNKSITTEKSLCTLHIMQVSVNNRKLENSSTYSFPHNALNIRVDFTAISFKSAGDIIYYYRLKGLDETWNTTTDNSINFPTLHPASYTLYIKAVNKFGVESDTKQLKITIRPAWWQTWLFRITAISIILLSIFLIYRYNVKSIRKKEEIKREFEAKAFELEQKALQAQMNPHFIFNALNSIQTFVLNLDAEGANTYLTNFANLIRQTLENSMHPLITVGSEVKYLETYLSLEKLRFRDKFEYTIQVDKTINVNTTLLPGMLLQPYIENSIRHGIQHRKDNNGKISLIITRTPDNCIQYLVKDNGVGRKRAAELRSKNHIEYQSRGTSINEKRIIAINNQFNTNISVQTEDILNDDGTVTGTLVTITSPHITK